MRFWNYATGEPWAITASALNTLLAIAAREPLPDHPPGSMAATAMDAIAARQGQILEHSQVTQVREGVAIIPVTGPLFRYANLFTAICGASSYELLAKDFTLALDHPKVSAIVLDVDSPGGEVNGCAEFARMMYDARGHKPILAYASGDAASGAYWIASACDEVVVSDTAMLGSIGVVAAYRDSGAHDRLEIVSSQSPFKRLNPNDEADRVRLQARIDALASVFVDAVARHRGIEPTTVLNDFGGGDVFIGQRAVDQGLADRTGSLESLIQQYGSPSNNHLPAVHTFPLSTLYSGDDDLVSDAPQSPLEDPLMTDPVLPTDAADSSALTLATLKTDHPQLIDALHAEWATTDIPAAIVQGRQQERERLSAILDAQVASGREPLARHLALTTDLPAEQALAVLQASPLQPTPVSNDPTGFEQAMARLGNPAIEPDDEASETDEVDAVAQRIAGFSHGGAV